MVGKARDDTTGTGDESAAQVTGDARIGHVVGGRWALKCVLGRGGSATVYEAVHRNGHHAALKVLHPELALQAPVVRRFLREGYAANRVAHPGAVKVLDDGVDSGLVYIVLELLRGRSLADRFVAEGRRMNVQDVARAAIQTLDVLAAAHEVGVIHRDVKPSNLFELHGGGLKLLDFGVARVQGPADPSITRSGVALGTPAFMAPEVAAGRADEVDALTDIWSLGATMFWLLSGRPVHGALTGNAAIVAAATREAPAIRDLVPRIPAGVAAVVDHALAFERGKRWPNARAMSRALSQAIPDYCGTPLHNDLEVGETLGTAPAAPTARRIAQVAAVLCAVALAGQTLAHITSSRLRSNPAPAKRSADVRNSPTDLPRDRVDAVSPPPFAESRPSHSAKPKATSPRTAAPVRSAGGFSRRAEVSDLVGDYHDADEALLDRRK